MYISIDRYICIYFFKARKTYSFRGEYLKNFTSVHDQFSLFFSPSNNKEGMGHGHGEFSLRVTSQQISLASIYKKRRGNESLFSLNVGRNYIVHDPREPMTFLYENTNFIILNPPN